MSRRRVLDVAVVGAGVVGSAAALVLAQQGLRVALVEARAPHAWSREDARDLRVFAIAPASVELFRRVGVWDAICSARAQPYREMRVWDAAQPGELHLRASDRGHAALGWIVEQAVLQDALWQALRREPNVVLRCPATVQSLEGVSAAPAQEGEASAVASLHANPLHARKQAWEAVQPAAREAAKDGYANNMRQRSTLASGARQHAEARTGVDDRHGLPASDVGLQLDDGERLVAKLVLAADGAASPLRQLAGIHVATREYGQRGLVAYVRTEQPHADTAWQRFLPGGPLALLPCTDGLSSIVWTLPDAEAERLLALDEASFGQALTRAFDARLGAMTLASPRAAFALRRQLAQCYVAGRVALVGDAAHVVHPLAGQGVNLGLQDVRELAVRLENTPDAGAPHALRRYERTRRSDNALAAHAFEGLNRLFSNQAFVPTLLRGPALGLVDRIAPLKRLLVKHAGG